MLIGSGLYQSYVATMKAVVLSRLKITASALANEQFEIIRNMPYDDVGIQGGIPDGKVLRTQTLVRDGTTFDVETTIRNVDDPFDGTIGGSPNDLSPADYRLVHIEVVCPTCINFSPVHFTTYVGPRALESASTNGALFVRVFDAAGQPVVGADVHVENNLAVPVIVINDTTDSDGFLKIVDAPPGVGAYEISVSKSGYSSEQTHEAGAPGNPNPTKPHATVAVQQLTQLSFAIDRTSTLNVSSVTDTCTPIGSIDFSLSGAKLIGTSPDVLKYSASHVTDGSGLKTIPTLEWDTYNIAFTDGSYDLSGTIPLLPLTLNPNAAQDFKLIVAPKDPRSVLITVKDGSTQLPLSGASVRLEGPGGYDTTLTTGRGFIRQTDWSGGPGQSSFTDTTHFSISSNIEHANPAGEIRLWGDALSGYATNGYLVSSTFDTGSVSNFHQILWQPQTQPPDTGAESVRFQVATNNDNATWNFRGPDDTENTYYTVANQNISIAHNGDRYFRYKAFLQTASSTWTPSVSDVSFTFTSSCVPPGQVFFTGLNAGDYTLTVSKTGYQNFSDTISVSSNWQKQEVVITP